MMGDTAAFTVTKENVEDDRALLKTGVIGTGSEVLITKNKIDNLLKLNRKGGKATNPGPLHPCSPRGSLYLQEMEHR